MVKNKGRCIITMRSVTYAMRATEILASKGIPSQVITVDASISKKGCSNGIELNCRFLYLARDILLSQNIPISDIIGG